MTEGESNILALTYLIYTPKVVFILRWSL